MGKLTQSMLAPYKVVILAAGKGTRLAPLTDSINKALLPVGSKASISHIIEKFDPAVDIVVALGYEKEKIKEYLALAHPHHRFVYVDVDKIDGPGSGPGYSLLACRQHLQCPFIFFAVDTLVEEEIPEPTQNWLGISPVQDTASYNSVSMESGFVTNMQDKVACDNSHAFIGLCGIEDYQVFWEALEGNDSLILGERQISSGLQALVRDGVAGVEFTWHDTGTLAGYEAACQHFSTEDEGFDFSKTGEHIYFVKNRVIKFFTDEATVQKRVQRAKSLVGFTPHINKQSKHFYAYERISGDTLYHTLHSELAATFFGWLAERFWAEGVPTSVDQEVFRKACQAFYYDKTVARIDEYYKRVKSQDSLAIVNGIPTPFLSSLLARLNWDELASGIPSRFHGDLQFDNILVTGRRDKPFVLLDWRQDFAGLTDYGDRYYDLAKLYGGHIIPYHLIKKNMFSYEEDGGSVRFDIASTYALNESRAVYEKFIHEQGYDMRKVRTLTALIFLNMSPLHTPPFNKLLHHLGKVELMRVLEVQPSHAYARK